MWELVISAVIGGFIATGGSALLQWIGQAHENRKRQRDLRKEIYLEAADSLNRLKSMISAEVSIESLTDVLRQAGIAYERVNLVAGEETYRAFCRFHERFLIILFDLIEKKIALDTKLSSLRDLELTQERIGEGQKYLLSLIQRLDPLSDEARRYADEFRQGDERWKAAQEKVSALSREASDLRWELVQWALASVKELGQVNLEVLISTRRELGFDRDESQIRRLAAEQSNRVEQLVSKRVESWRALEAPDDPSVDVLRTGETSPKSEAG